MQHFDPVATPYDIAAGVMMGVLILMSLFYSADALHGERRDRSILFWKSLPVSDRTTVLAKASIPLVVLPSLAFALTTIMQIIMLLASTLVLAANGMSVASLWRDVAPFTRWANLLYHLFTAHALWPFPVFSLADSGFRVGAARGVALGGIAGGRDRRRREAVLPLLEFRDTGG